MPDRSEPFRTEQGARRGVPDSIRAIDALSAAIEEHEQEIRSLHSRVIERDQIIADLKNQVTERGLFATWLESEIARRDERIGTLSAEIDGHKAEIDRLQSRWTEMTTRLPWRATEAFRSNIARIRATAASVRRLAHRWAERTSGKRTPAIPIATPSDEVATTGPSPVRTDNAIPSIADTEQDGHDPNEILRYIPARRDPFDEWLRNNAWNAASEAEARLTLQRLNHRPTFSIIVSMPEGNKDAQTEIRKQIQAQIDPDWELICVGIGANESSSARSVADAASHAHGDYLLFLDDQTRLAPDALVEMAREVVAGNEPVLIYTDEDRIDTLGRRFGPRFRPGWSPELLLSHLYLGRSFAVRRDVYEQIGGLRPEFETAWPYDLALRVTECPGRVAHVPRVLVHAPGDREQDGSFDRASARGVSLAAQALSEALERRGIVAPVGWPDWAARDRVPVFDLDFPDEGPPVAILIPTKNRAGLLKRCLDSIVSRTSYRNMEIFVIDNGSDEPETLALLDQLPSGCHVLRMPSHEGRFNFARIHNEAIRGLDDRFEYVLLLNNDTEVRRPEWLSQLVGYARIPGVGAVGARLLYADGRVQHAGVLSALYDGNPGHAFRLAPWWDEGYLGHARIARNYSALTGACFLIRRSTYLDHGGFDEERFAIAYNDVDLCLRLVASGMRCVYAPRAELFHFEGASRGFDDDAREAVAYRNQWGAHIDPYHNPNLSGRDERLGLCTRRRNRVETFRDHPLRVAIGVSNLDRNEGAMFARDLARHLRDRGRVQATILSPRAVTPAPSREGAGVPVDIASDGERPGTRPLDHARELARRLAREHYDVVHADGLDRFVLIHAARLAGIPAIWSIRESIDFRDAFGSFDEETAIAAIEAFSYAYRVTFPAWGVRRLFHPVESRANYSLVYENVPPDLLPPHPISTTSAPFRNQFGIPEDRIVLTCLDTMGDEGPRDVFDTVAELLRQGGDFDTVFLSPAEGQRWTSSIEMVRRRGGRVHVPDPTAPMSPVLAASDIVVCCSRRDLAPRALLLAQAWGCPIVSSNVAGVDEYVGPDRTTLRYAPNDTSELLSCLERLLHSPEARRRFSEAGRLSPALRPSFDDLLRQYESLYAEARDVGPIAVSDDAIPHTTRRDAA